MDPAIREGREKYLGVATRWIKGRVARHLEVGSLD
jgi:hypothetical protein